MSDVFRDLFAPLAAPVRALAVSLVGVAVAWFWFNNLKAWTAVAIVPAAAGLALDWFGAHCLPRHPVRGLILMEGWILTPAVIAILAEAALIIITVQLSVPDNAPPSTRGLVAVLTTGVTGFITAAFITRVGTGQDEIVGKHIRRHFFANYKRVPEDGNRESGIQYFPAESIGERLVYSDGFGDIVGWGWPDRLHRAQRIAKELTT